MNILFKIYRFINSKYQLLSTKWEKEKLRKKSRYIKGVTTLIKPKISYVDSISLLAGYTEIFEEKCYDLTIKSKKPIIIDCGANIGLATIFFKKQYPTSQIICFEPDPDIFKVLKSNIEHFKFKDIQLRNEAVWYDDTNITFRREGGFSGRVAIGIDTKKSNLIEVKAIKLSDFLNCKIDLLKMDIEGAELEVLKSIENKLVNIRCIFIEYHSPISEKQKLDELLRILNRNCIRYYIKEAFVPKHPFKQIDSLDGMDLQLNIYGIKNS